MRPISRIICSAAALMLMPMSAALAQISERTIKFSFLNSADHPQGLGAAKFAEDQRQVVCRRRTGR